MCRKQVLALDVEAREPGTLFGSRQLRPCLLRKGDTEAKVPRARRKLVAGFSEAFLRVLTHRLEHSIAAAIDVDDDERFLDQFRKQVEDFVLLDPAARADDFGRFEGPSAREN
jgi:hypothetical protein